MIGAIAATAVLSSLPVSVAHATAVSLARTEIGVDYVSAGIGGLGLGSGTGTITIGGVSGTVRKAFLYWHGIDGSAIGAGDGIYDNATITLNGSPVTGLSLGDASTNCWGSGSSRGFFADVTNLFTGNGAYTVDGLNAAPGHSGNGASLLVMFNDGNPSNNRDLVFFEGNDSDISDFPATDPNGWQATLNNINYGGGAVYAQAHVGDGQDSPDDSITFASGAGSVVIPDTSNLWDGNSTPTAGNSRSPYGSMWDVHTFDISGAFGAPGNYTLDFSGMAAPDDCHSLTVMIIDLAAGAAPCGNGTLDQGEQCDPNESVSSCVAPESCLTNCTCGCVTDFDCNDGVPCTADACVQATGECTHIDNCGTTTTTLPPPPTQACCMTGPQAAGQCVDIPVEICAQYLGVSQGSGTSCQDLGICAAPSTTTTSSSTTTTTPPPTGACCVAGQCRVATQVQCDVGTYQGDGTNCDTPGICAACGDGLIEQGEECDDGNTAAGDGCDGKCTVEQCWVCTAETAPTTTLPVLPGPSICTHDDGATCDDGDICTVGDTCGGGTCSGNAVLIPAACKWVIVGDTGVQSRTRGESAVTGHVCGGRVRLGEFSTTNGDAVATLAAGVGIQISSHAAVSGDIVTGGSAVNGKPRLVLLPGLTTDVVAGGTTAVQSGDPTAIYDTLGTNARVSDCAAAQGDFAAGDSLLSLLPAGPDLGDKTIAASTSFTLTATNPGGLNVFDFKTLVSRTDGTLTLDGAGNAGSIFVVRVKKKLDLRLRSKVVLAGSTVPGKVIFYSQGKCRFGLELSGAGTVFCPKGKLAMNARTHWQGALMGGKRRVEMRNSGVLIHAPLQVGP